MRLYTYVVEHDFGFAPNPFHAICTLATCKPKIRKSAQIGDYIAGMGCAERGRHGHLVYFMQVSEESEFDAYWRDRRFFSKRPMLRGSKMQAFGDNIYHRDPRTGRWIQENSFHSRVTGIHLQNLLHDTSTSSRVLIGKRFGYWGGSGPKIPARFRNFDGRDICGGRGHQCRYSPQLVAAFVAWIEGLDTTGYLGRPHDWSRTG